MINCENEFPIPAHIGGTVLRDANAEIFKRMPAGDRGFIDCSLADRPVTPSQWHGVAAQEVMEVALTSQRTGQWASVRPR